MAIIDCCSIEGATLGTLYTTTGVCIAATECSIGTGTALGGAATVISYGGGLVGIERGAVSDRLTIEDAGSGRSYSTCRIGIAATQYSIVATT